MRVSVIIAAFNEADIISETIGIVQKYGGDNVLEILVVDGGSTDQTEARAEAAGARVVTSPCRGRAVQMNYGAEGTKGKILYFLHADTHPPENFADDIINTCNNGADAGCFRLAFDHDHFLLNFYAWCTQFDIDAFRFGDQSLFIERNTFAQVGGFREDHIVMEDQEIVRRIKKEYTFDLLPSEVVTSARRYIDKGILKLQLVFILIFTLFYLGLSQQQLAAIYERWVS